MSITQPQIQAKLRDFIAAGLDAGKAAAAAGDHLAYRNYAVAVQRLLQAPPGKMTMRQLPDGTQEIEITPRLLAEVRREAEMTARNVIARTGAERVAGLVEDDRVDTYSDELGKRP